MDWFVSYVDWVATGPIIIYMIENEVFFFALRTVARALASNLSPEKSWGSMFGMLNLIGEIGAALSPVVSGVLRG